MTVRIKRIFFAYLLVSFLYLFLHFLTKQFWIFSIIGFQLIFLEACDLVEGQTTTTDLPTDTSTLQSTQVSFLNCWQFILNRIIFAMFIRYNGFRIAFEFFLLKHSKVFYIFLIYFYNIILNDDTFLKILKRKIYKLLTQSPHFGAFYM